MKCTLVLAPPSQALPHTDFCFYALPVKQLVGLNRSNDVSTSSAPPSFPRLAIVSTPAFSWLLLCATHI
jgi:hypothetical protein